MRCVEVHSVDQKLKCRITRLREWKSGFINKKSWFQSNWRKRREELRQQTEAKSHKQRRNTNCLGTKKPGGDAQKTGAAADKLQPRAQMTRKDKDYMHQTLINWGNTGETENRCENTQKQGLKNKRKQQTWGDWPSAGGQTGNLTRLPPEITQLSSD